MKKIILAMVLSAISASSFAGEAYSLKCNANQVVVMFSDNNEQFALVGKSGQKISHTEYGSGQYTGVNGVTLKGVTAEVFARVHNDKEGGVTGKDSLIVNSNDSFTLIYYGDDSGKVFRVIKNDKNDACKIISYNGAINS
ncbi:hypothetical protein AB6F95_004632 [Salmonella enterica]